MLRFDDRFARQNRCEPPPEFPLASPYTGIVHLLSGPAPYALTQIHPRTSGSVDDAPTISPAFTFITRRGLPPEHSHTKTTPWSVFQDGSLLFFTPASLQCVFLGPLRGICLFYTFDAVVVLFVCLLAMREPRSPQRKRAKG